MSIKYLNDAWNMPLNAHEKIVLLAISDWANDEGVAYPSYKALMKKTGMAKATLAKHIKLLRDLGSLKTENHSHFGQGKKVNLYTISSRAELPYGSDIELMDRIKELRKKHASTYSSRLEPAKVQFVDTYSSHLEHEPPVITTIQEPSVMSATFVADYLASKIKNNNPKTRPNPQAWVADIEKAIRIDNRTKQDLISIIDWMYEGDQFWSGVVLSGKKLRDKFDAMIMQESRNDTRSKQAISGQPNNSATRHHDRLKALHAKAVADELDNPTIQQIPSDIQPQMAIGNRYR